MFFVTIHAWALCWVLSVQKWETWMSPTSTHGKKKDWRAPKGATQAKGQEPASQKSG